MPTRALLLLLIGMLAGCSTLPPTQYPPFVEHAVRATFVVAADGRLALPTTTNDFVMQQLTLSPPALREEFDRDGSRWFCYPAGTQVQAELRWRQYAPVAEQRTPQQALPHAHALQSLREVAP